jgi:hypothetical protein
MAPVPRRAPGGAGLRGASLARLDHLAGALARQGMDAAPLAPPGRVPRLRVTHPSGMTEEVYAGRCHDGSWWFWWPWAERIAPESDTQAAAATIGQVLARPPGRD